MEIFAIVSGSRKLEVEISREEDLQGSGERMRIIEVSILRVSAVKYGLYAT